MPLFDDQLPSICVLLSSPPGCLSKPITTQSCVPPKVRDLLGESYRPFFDRPVASNVIYIHCPWYSKYIIGVGVLDNVCHIAEL